MEWLVSGGVYTQTSGVKTQTHLQNGMFTVSFDSQMQRFELKFVKKKFKFPYKIYDLDNALINRVTKTYKSTNGNLGVLLNGTKGTGKTVTTKNMCNALSMPVLIITENIPGLAKFINQIEQDIIVLIDEYEKVFKGDNSTGQLLSVMDGVLENGHRRVFLLTTNQLYVNVNILQRPGRVRYLKKYTDLELHTIEEILDDLLEKPAHREAIIEFLSQLKLITVDIVKAVVSEVNIHDEPPSAFEKVFNIEKVQSLYSVWKINENEDDEIMFSGVDDHYMKQDGYTKSLEDSQQRLQRKVVTIKKVHAPDEITITLQNSKGKNKDIRIQFIPEDTVHRAFAKPKTVDGKKPNVAPVHKDPQYDSDY